MKSGKRALSRCWWLAFLVVLSFVFVAASECEQTSDNSPPQGSEQPDLTRIVSAVPGATAEAEGVRVTLNEIVDPWLSDTFMEPDAGRRFVAFDVTIQNVDGGTQIAAPFGFKLSDAEDFAYDWSMSGPDPGLHFIDLGSGQKTRGWVTFEVNGGTPLKLLKYDPDPFTTNDIEFQFPTDTATAPTTPTASECDYPIVTQCGPHYDAYTGQYDTGCVQGHYETGRFVQNRTNCSRPFPMPSPSPTLTPAPTPAQPPTATPTSTGGDGTYTVEAGDTVYAIALKFGITVEELASANNMTVEQIAQLSVGQKLIIPKAAPGEQQPVTTATPEGAEPVSTSTPAAAGGGTYTVQDGDYPTSIAEKFGISAEALMEANGITDPSSLKLGQVLVIPTPTTTPPP